MLSILIGLACIAIIVAFAEPLIAGLLWIGVAALGLGAIAVGLIILAAVAPYLGTLFPIGLGICVFVWAVYMLIWAAARWRMLAREGCQRAQRFLVLISAKVQGITDPKKWSAGGAFVLAVWLFAISLAAVVPVAILLDGQGPWSPALRFALIGLFLAAFAVGGFGVIWRAVEWLRTPNKRLSGYAKFAFSVGGVLLPAGQLYRVFPPAGVLTLVGLLMWTVALVLVARGDARRPDQDGSNA